MMPRQARLDTPGTLHHVIIRGIERRKIVNDDRDRRNFIFRMGSMALETETLIYAWALMTNHAHILLRSGASGLSRYMRRFLTGYAISYNCRHHRHGHLFQNRYKSIVCEEDPYFKELIRYIHLNPLRAKLVENITKLNSYRYCGHSVLIGRVKNDWQDRDYVLKWFGPKEGEAIRVYRRFIEKGIDQGRRHDLVGGGLIRSQGGWSAVNAIRHGIREKSDERILGSGAFVEQLIQESDQVRKEQFAPHERMKRAVSYIEKICMKEKVSVEALKTGSRRQKVSMVRKQLAKKLVEGWGFSLTETGRYLGVTASAITKTLYRLNHHKFN
jgi:putative transposase